MSDPQKTQSIQKTLAALQKTVSTQKTASAPNKPGEPVKPAAAAHQAGERIVVGGKEYTIEKVLGSGAEGDLYVVTDGRRRYALKLCHEGYKTNTKVLRRLETLKGRGYSVEIISYNMWRHSLSQRHHPAGDGHDHHRASVRADA